MKLALQRRNGTVPRDMAERKRQFRKALALAEMTAGEWAKGQKIGASYLSRFLAGQTVSRPLTIAVDAFIAKYAKHLRSVA